METAMTMQTRTSQWWEAAVVVLAAIVIIGGLSNAKIGSRRVQTQAAT